MLHTARATQETRRLPCTGREPHVEVLAYHRQTQASTSVHERWVIISRTCDHDVQHDATGPDVAGAAVKEIVH